MILSFTRPMKNALLITLAAASLIGCSTASKLFSSTRAPAEVPVDGNGIVQTVQNSKLFGVVPVYRPDIWDYPFRIRKGDGEITSSRVVVFFKEGRVSHFEGGDLPEENDYLLRIAAPQNK
ncbi:MAG: outer membrane protein assembly factor BamE [Oxalobacteraceae bacterium]|nr:outer membrane protein assembly factor BamE [Oxalobacteraceae bacterium]